MLLAGGDGNGVRWMLLAGALRRRRDVMVVYCVVVVVVVMVLVVVIDDREIVTSMSEKAVRLYIRAVAVRSLPDTPCHYSRPF